MSAQCAHNITMKLEQFVYFLYSKGMALSGGLHTTCRKKTLKKKVNLTEQIQEAEEIKKCANFILII